MRHVSRAAAFAAGLVLAGHAFAQSPAGDFVTANGHERVEIEPYLEDYRAMLVEDAGSAFQTDSGLGPVEKAFVFVDAVEGALPNARWLYRFGQTTREASAGGPQTRYFVDVARFNLGPALHAETREIHGAQNTASPEEFGDGPSVSWRFVMRPIMGSTADFLEAGRREWTRAAADGARCFGAPCLAAEGLIETMIGEASDWDEIDAPGRDGDLPYADSEAAAMIRQAERLHGFLGQSRRWREPEKPERVGAGPDPYIGGLVETGLAPGGVSEVAMLYAGVNDGSVRDIWYRIADFGGDLMAMRHTVPWPRSR